MALAGVFVPVLLVRQDRFLLCCRVGIVREWGGGGTGYGYDGDGKLC